MRVSKTCSAGLDFPSELRPTLAMPRSIILSGMIRAHAIAILVAASLAATAQKPAKPPLHTEGHQIVDAAGHPVRLPSVNWYGFDQKEFVVGGLDHASLQTIVGKIQELGVNSVRLPWAN